MRLDAEDPDPVSISWNSSSIYRRAGKSSKFRNSKMEEGFMNIYNIVKRVQLRF